MALWPSLLTNDDSVDEDSHTSNAQDEATDVESVEVGGEGDTEPPTNQSQASEVERDFAAEPADMCRKEHCTGGGIVNWPQFLSCMESAFPLEKPVASKIFLPFF